MSNGALTGKIKHNYKNKLLARQSDLIEKLNCFLKETVDSIEWNRCGSEFQALGPENENLKVHSPKIVRSLGRMHRAWSRSRTKTCTSNMVSNELHSITVVRRTAASVDEMH